LERQHVTQPIGASFPDVDSLLYADAPTALRRAIATLQARAYGGPDDGAPLHDPALNARSFFIRSGEAVASYAGVVFKDIQHGGQRFSIAGLACVATDPALQRQWLGRRVVAAATRQLAQSGVDLGVFTCAPQLAPFYAAAGAWPVAPDVTLIGSAAAGALSSTALGVVVLLRLYSPRAHAASDTLLHGTLDLDLPLGQFL
jgi:GNAT superfamily N-acetyltransferase